MGLQGSEPARIQNAGRALSITMERIRMIQRIPLIVLAVAVMLVGCTPSSESIVRRTATGSADGEGLNPATLTPPTGVSKLDPAERHMVLHYGPTIKACASECGFDWRLILAIVRQESRFNAGAESHRGATGFMQVMPVTLREVVDDLDMQDETHPSVNIRIGVFYLRKLYGMFDGAQEPDRLRLALASYNGGLGRIYDAQEIAAYLGDNPEKWDAVKDALPLLSKRYVSLHSHIWPEDRPRNGWFGGSKETTSYVDSVMATYEEYMRDIPD